MKKLILVALLVLLAVSCAMAGPPALTTTATTTSWSAVSATPAAVVFARAAGADAVLIDTMKKITTAAGGDVGIVGSFAALQAAQISVTTNAITPMAITRPLAPPTTASMTAVLAAAADPPQIAMGTGTKADNVEFTAAKLSLVAAPGHTACPSRGTIPAPESVVANLGLCGAVTLAS